jgi:hypothetical protein
MRNDTKNTAKDQLRDYIRIALFAVAFAGIIYTTKHDLGRVGDAAFYLLCGGLLVDIVVVGISNGSTTLVHSTVVRIQDPLGFWLAIAISGFAGCVAIALSIGVLFGQWQL